jgi:outer membrane protein assembly factor BamD (BamD/ComL family)
MKDYLKNVRERLAKSSHIGLQAKAIILTMSFVQSYWVPIACAAGTVVAAEMFGDKAHWREIGKNVQKMAAEKKPDEVVKYVEGELANYAKWREGHPEAQYTDQAVNNLYFQLAKAKESAGVPKKTLMKEYKHAVLSSDHIGESLGVLFEILSLDNYKNTVKEVIKKNKTDLPYSKITKQLQSSNNWQAFAAFLDELFAENEGVMTIAKYEEKALDNNTEWTRKFDDYCRANPKLINYIYQKDCNAAEENINKENFTNAISIYKNLLKSGLSSTQVSEIDFKICECLFSGGRYKDTLSEIDQFIAKNKSTNRTLAKNAILLKGQTYIQLGDIKKAIAEFSSLLIEYSETKQAPEANFFIGYCYMLQGNFDQAKEVLNLVVKDYPQSSYASKAKLCLTRIETMTK